MTRKRFQKLLISRDLSARAAKTYKIPSIYNNILYYCHSTDGGKTWTVLKGASYQSWWNDSIIETNKGFILDCNVPRYDLEIEYFS